MTNAPAVHLDDIIESNQLPEPVKVVMVQPDGSGLRIMGAGVSTNLFYDRGFGPGQFTVRRVTFSADGSRLPLIDILHRSELLWAAGQQDVLEEFLDDVLPGDHEALRRVAQALMDLLPRGDLEEQRLEGFLYSGVALDSGDGTAPRRVAPVQAGLGTEFGMSDAVVRGNGRRR